MVFGVKCTGLKGKASFLIFLRTSTLHIPRHWCHNSRSIEYQLVLYQCNSSEMRNRKFRNLGKIHRCRHIRIIASTPLSLIYSYKFMSYSIPLKPKYIVVLGILLIMISRNMLAECKILHSTCKCNSLYNHLWL